MAPASCVRCCGRAHSVVAQTLTDELDEVLDGRSPTVADLPALEYAEMVLQESMRLYPPVWFFNRTAIEDDEIGGYPIPAGSIVTIRLAAVLP